MFGTLYLPHFYLQAVLRHHPELTEKPVGLIDDQAKKAVIIQLNKMAEENGVQRGMTPSQGLARCLQLIVKTRSVVQEDRVQGILLHFAGTLAPFVESTGPGISTVQFTDPKNLREKMLRAIAQLAGAEITAKAGIASTPDASFLAAHRADPVLQIDDATKFLASLPIEALL